MRTRIVGYTYQADTWCPACIVSAMGEHQHAATEDTLTMIALRRGIDRLDEHTFDSDDFPKVIFSIMVEDPEHCAECGEEIG